MPDVDAIIAYGEGYDQGSDTAHRELREWRPGRHRPECCCASCVTGHALWATFVDEAIAAINAAVARRRIDERATLE